MLKWLRPRARFPVGHCRRPFRHRCRSRTSANHTHADGADIIVHSCELKYSRRDTGHCGRGGAFVGRKNPHVVLPIAHEFRNGHVYTDMDRHLRPRHGRVSTRGNTTPLHTAFPWHLTTGLSFLVCRMNEQLVTASNHDSTLGRNAMTIVETHACFLPFLHLFFSVLPWNHGASQRCGNGFGRRQLRGHDVVRLPEHPVVGRPRNGHFSWLSGPYPFGEWRSFQLWWQLERR
jgi:hypothetical protein